MAQLQILTQSAGGYHYHALVREMLQARLAHDQPLWRTAMQRGAQWYQENGALPQAVDAWIALRDWQAARKLIETGGHNCLQRGERLQLMQWIDALPANFVNQSEKLLCLRVWAFNDAEKFVVGEALLDRAEALISQGPPPDLHDQQTLLCEIFSLRAIISRLRMDGVAAIHYSQRALQYADGAVFPLRWRSYLTLGSHEYIIGEFDSAEAKLIQAVAFAKADGHLYAVAQCAGYLALCIAQKAQLRRARAVLNDAIVWLEQRLFDRLPAGCWRNIGLVEYHRECGEFDQAWHYLRPLLQFRYDPACELMQHLIILLLWYGLSMSARQYDETRQALNALMMLDQELHFEWLFAFGSLGALQARYAQHTGDLAGASEWVLANRDALLRHESFVANIDRLMALSICNQSNELALSQEFLVRVQQTGCFAQQRKLHIGYLVQQSIWTAKTDRLDSAAELLDSALALGGDEGFVQLYLDEGAAITPLLGHCKHPRAQQLLQKSHSGVQQQVLVSLRELDVLRQVCDGLSDKEISRRLAITPGTVKTHLRNIYRKLGVKRRTQAISRAKALHLIDG
jgi:LuxR family maltose regulon positive regulatory protein